MQSLDGAAAVNSLVAVTCLILARAVWVRRWTLRPSSERLKLVERTMTVSLILRAAGLCLMSPASATTVGRLLHAIFGQWQLDTWVGHCLYVSAAGLTVTSIKGRLFVKSDDIRTRFKRSFELPITIVAPVTLMLLTKSLSADTYRADMFDVPTDVWLGAYWTVITAFVAFLLVRAWVALMGIRLDVRSRGTAAVYLAACGTGIAGCALQVVCVWAGLDFGRYFWVANCAVAAVFAWASARSWRRKARTLIPWVRL